MTKKWIYPWKAASLSWLLPGLGQSCVGRPLRAFALFMIYLSLHVVVFYTLSILFYNSIYWAFIISILPLSVFSLLAGLDASWCVEKPRRNHNDKVQASGKNVWLAVFLSLVWPGLGHAYLKKWFLFVLCSLIYLSLFLLDPGSKIYRPLFRILVCIHVGRIFNATVARRDFYKFIAVAVLILFTINVAAPALRARCVLKVSFPKESSMGPALKAGDMVLINRLAYILRKPKVGDIINIDSKVTTYMAPKLRDHLKLNREKPYGFIKRIIAVGGDSVQIKKDGIYVNDVLQKDIMVGNSTGLGLIRINGLKIERLATRQLYRVPENCFFVLGDNIENSLDSRDFGAVPRSMIIGKVIKVISPKS
jgi:signal peptidase I